MSFMVVPKKMVRAALFFVMVIVLSGCQTGRIPCPKVKGQKSTKVPKRYKPYYSANTRAEDPQTGGTSAVKAGKSSQERYIKNISVEEWDCPEPGTKRYLPKHVKENIRRNFAKIKEEQKHSKADSVANR